jgi:hypothetical protein
LICLLKRLKNAGNFLLGFKFCIVFGIDDMGKSVEGLHAQAGQTLKKSGKLSLKSFASHTWAIRIIISAVISWLLFLSNRWGLQFETL